MTHQNNRSTTLPSDFSAACDAAWLLMSPVPGFISRAECDFLSLAALATPAEGCVLEIGSYCGRSTVALASIVKHYGLDPIVAVDPFNAPSSTDPDLEGESSSYGAFQRTIQGASLSGFVEVHQMRSSELALTWNRPIRFLWIDGDHTYPGTRTDLALFREYLTDGAIVAMHDALHDFPGPIRVFCEEVLQSDDFGPTGFVGSIAWAQYRPGDGAGETFRRSRRRLARKAGRLVPFVLGKLPVRGLRRLHFKLLRSLVPHGRQDPHSWLEAVKPYPSR